MSTRKGFTRRLIAAVGAATLATLGAATAAVAESELDPANIVGETGSFTLTKCKETGSGNPVDTVEGLGEEAVCTGLKDVNFTLYRVMDGSDSTVPIDLSTTAGWELVPDTTPSLTLDNSASPTKVTYTVDGASKTFKLSTGDTKKSGSDGEITWNSLDYGLYLVVEGTDEGGNKITSKAAPFLVSVPYPLQTTRDGITTSKWVYDVHAYPKNSVTGITKDVNNPEAATDSSQPHVVITNNEPIVTWDVTIDIPQLAEDASFTALKVEDTFDANLILPNAGDDNTYGVKVKILGAASGGGDVTLNSSGFKVEKSDQKLTVWLYKPATEAGGDPEVSTADDYQGKQAVITFSTQVKADFAGTIENIANLYVDDNQYVPSNREKTLWGRFSVLKYAENNTDQGLANAEFAIYEVPDGENATCDSLVLDGDDADQPIWGPESTGTDGTLTTPSLFVADTDEDATVDNTVFRTYCLVETKAPVGYVVSQKITAVDVYAKVAGSSETGADDNYVAISNPQEKVPDLPLTGANGQLLLTIGGVALVLVGTGVALVSRKRAANKQ